LWRSVYAMGGSGGNISHSIPVRERKHLTGRSISILGWDFLDVIDDQGVF
jgi:hypothetical protein